MDTPLDKYRQALDDIDRQLVDLMERRMAVSLSVAAYKKEQGLPVLDANREREVLKSRAAMAKKPEHGPALAEVFRLIMEKSREVQQQYMDEQP